MSQSSPSQSPPVPPAQAADRVRRIVTRHAARQVSGELIFRATSVEVHVYLHRGRVAWATTSDDPKGMLRHLMEEHGVEREALAAAVEACAREHKRFGETLVAWGLATEEQVRAALLWQVLRSVASLEGRENLHWIFLGRPMDYDARLTFELGEIWLPRPRGPRGSAAPRATLSDEAVARCCANEVVPGVLCCHVLDARSGRSLARHGTDAARAARARQVAEAAGQLLASVAHPRGATPRAPARVLVVDGGEKHFVVSLPSAGHGLAVTTSTEVELDDGFDRAERVGALLGLSPGFDGETVTAGDRQGVST